MLHSMTGFVSHECEVDDYHLVWEVKTLNHRFFDMTMKLPEALRCLEVDLRNVAKSYLKRGKMDVNLYFKNRNLRNNIELSDERLNEILGEFVRVRNAFVIEGFEPGQLQVDLARLLADPAYTGNDGRSFEDEFKNKIINSFGEAIKKLEQTRLAEGIRLRDVLETCLCNMKQITAEICQYSRGAKEQIHQKLVARVKELAANVTVDPIRLEQEILLLAQKADIQEELDRLNSHYCAITQLLSSDEQVGRKLDFLMQELNRESNTICSKSTDINIINRAVNLKTYIEQMREQIQNIE